MSEGANGWGVVSNDNIVRRIVGADPISVQRNLDLLNPSIANDLQISLDMNLSGLMNYYTRQQSDSTFEPVSRILVSDYPYGSGSDWFWQLGRLSLPNDGHHAVITVNACNGWNLNFRSGLSGENFNGYNITNYQMTAHIYSSTPNTSRAVDPGSLGVPGAVRYNDPTYSLFYNGFVVATSPFITPLGFYLAPVPGNPLNQVDIWIHSPRWHGNL